MSEMNFCPHCEAATHKLLHCKEDIFFCKACSRFFRFESLDQKCPRCTGSLRKSDFDSPSKGAVFLCTKCKKTCTTQDLFEEEN
ncbi:hypothetical protein GOV09_04760 [Candidatus Woesearchaeota archaeon]|nr:hypothetical protein [Candidatus Woesearchaeota archaeon]